MEVEIEEGECESCREPISAWEWVNTDNESVPWCSLCALVHAAPCEVCSELVSDAAAYRVSRAQKDAVICPNDLLTWSLGERLNPVKKLVSIFGEAL